MRILLGILLFGGCLSLQAGELITRAKPVDLLTVEMDKAGGGQKAMPFDEVSRLVTRAERSFCNRKSSSPYGSQTLRLWVEMDKTGSPKLADIKSRGGLEVILTCMPTIQLAN